MTTPSRRLEVIKHHLNPNDKPHFETLHMNRKSDEVPYVSKLDPLSFLLRSAMVHTHKTAIIHREQSYSYLQFSERVRALANVLIHTFNVKPGDRVGILCQNIPSFIEAQYAVPAIGAITVPMNTKLAAKEIEYVSEHSGVSVLIVQQELLNRVTEKIRSSVKLIQVADSNDPNTDPYEILLSNTDKRLSWNDLPRSRDENDLISINYTSGSTGKPKGVMVSFRGAYMMALGMAVHVKLAVDTVYLWTLPMFHCNGWGFPWAIVAVGGTQVMLNKIDYTLIWKLLKKHGITHYNGAPTVQNEICNHEDATRLNHPVYAYSGGSALPSVLIKRMEALNLIPTQVYGLTETYGPAVFTYDHHTLSDYTEEEQYKLLARPGFNIITSDEVRVLNVNTAQDVKPNGKEIGEICFTGNLVMRGYYKNPEETKKAFRNGVYWTGDLAVRHPDGSIEIVDRSKDVIVSGGENISSIEVESVILELDEISECAIVAGPDDRWGERPVAYIVLKKNRILDARSVINHCRKCLAGYKCPDRIIFIHDIPKTSIGKVQKFKLRESLWANYKKRVN
ncbi:uncharacterized protein BX663DRAFT_513518 [Cokeromyces recurvatus]|uniref:uncharacterized protein n=1 Tax=Cokeromyces recurvatus TaxID=90255 RepID=UPI00221F587D|nr:uncharacterized protein BX663DRAFT_513518 [Cokeromyces recurvatus]KAI7901641.1 hypothetical protein BX663DRAFT_513518 [Cokeromyces recurvatus]